MNKICVPTEVCDLHNVIKVVYTAGWSQLLCPLCEGEEDVMWDEFMGDDGIMRDIDGDE